MNKSNSKYSLSCIFKSSKNKMFGVYETHEVKGVGGNGVFRGSVSSIRSMGKVLFFDVRHGKAKMQVYFQSIKNDKLSFAVKKLNVGDFVNVHGIYFWTETKERTLRLLKLEFIFKKIKNSGGGGGTGTDYQYHKKLNLKSNVLRFLRTFLYKNNFIEVETPVFQKNPGGALAKPFKTNSGFSFFYLRISLEIYLKKLMVSGCSRVFELGRVFRNEGGSMIHSNEFTMVEAYASFSKYGFMVKLVYALIQELHYKTYGCKYIINFNNIIFLNKVWRVLDYQETIRLFTRNKLWFNMSRLGKENYCLSIKKPLGFNLLKIKNIDNFVFDKLVSTKLLQPTFVTKFPRILCPLAKLNNLNSKFVDIFELYISGKELAPGYSEQTDPFIQSKLLVKQNKFKRSLYDKKFIDNLTRGVPYMSGIGLGVNRLIMILSNSKNIRDF